MSNDGELLTRLQDAKARIEAFLADGSLLEKARQLAGKLATATETMNEALRDVEDMLAERRALPRAVRLPGDGVLLWDGEYLMVLSYTKDEVSRRKLLETNRKTRVDACYALSAVVVPCDGSCSGNELGDCSHGGRP